MVNYAGVVMETLNLPLPFGVASVGVYACRLKCTVGGWVCMRVCTRDVHIRMYCMCVCVCVCLLCYTTYPTSLLSSTSGPVVRDLVGEDTVSSASPPDRSVLCVSFTTS